MAEQNSRLVHQAIEAIWNGGDLDLADRVFAPNYVNHGGLIPDLVRGPEAIKVSVALYRAAFPQFQVTVLDLLSQGQTVAVRWAAYRTPHREGANEAPDVLVGMTFGRVSGGQIAESWTCWEAGGAREGALMRDIRVLAGSAL